MKSSWILPDRKQSGAIWLDQSGNVVLLHSALQLHEIPRAFTLGIPEELFVANRDRPVFYLQFARLPKGESLFAASLEAGKDCGGRTVVLTLMVQLDRHETLRPESIASFKTPDEKEESYAIDLLSDLGRQFKERASPLNELFKAVETFPTLETFASEELRRSANQPAWMKKKRSGADSEGFSSQSCVKRACSGRSEHIDRFG